MWQNSSASKFSAVSSSSRVALDSDEQKREKFTIIFSGRSWRLTFAPRRQQVCPSERIWRMLRRLGGSKARMDVSWNSQGTLMELSRNPRNSYLALELTWLAAVARGR